MEKVIGGLEEKIELQRIEKSEEAELVAVYGRRRVGKTFLIRNGFSRGLSFEFSGMHHADLQQQLENFSMALTLALGNRLPLAKPESWLNAFEMLKSYLEPLLETDRRIILFTNFKYPHKVSKKTYLFLI